MKALDDFTSTVLFVQRRLDQDYERAAATKDAALEELTTKRMNALCLLLEATLGALNELIPAEEVPHA